MKITILQPQSCNEIGQRSNNEDRIYPYLNEATVGNRLFMVCDGMGGHEKGEVASNTVINSIVSFWQDNIAPDSPEKMNEAVSSAVNALKQIADRNEAKQMGTTLTLVSINEDKIVMAHIGDSRIYHLRPDEGILFCTKDHSLVQQWIDAGLLSEEDAQTHPKKNVITRAVQPFAEEKVYADVEELTDLKTGDYIFMCSDGITETITNDKLVDIINADISDVEKMETIKNLCLNNSKDNYSAYLIPLVVENAALLDDKDSEIEDEALKREIMAKSGMTDAEIYDFENNEVKVKVDETIEDISYSNEFSNNKEGLNKSKRQKAVYDSTKDNKGFKIKIWKDIEIIFSIRINRK